MDTLRKTLSVLSIVATLAVAGCSSNSSRTGQLSLPESPDESVTLRVRLPKSDEPVDWSKCFAVYVDNGDALSSSGPVQGTYRVAEDTLTFEPDFPFSPGVDYRVEVADNLAKVDSFDGVQFSRLGREFVGVSFCLPDSPSLGLPQVQRIFPTGDELPNNILRFYIYFSNPMKTGWAGRAVSLHGEDGNEVENVFMEFKQELWSPDQKRLTLLLDPGRIKRGVATNDRLGDALEVGHSYSLLINGAWPDAYGKPLGKDHEKTFRVISPVRSKVALGNWVVNPPTAGTTSPLEIAFDRPLDHALLKRLLCVRDANGREVLGRVEPDHWETQCLFIPHLPWKSGAYLLTAQPELEDLAGNNLRGPMDHQVGDNHKAERETTLDFVVVSKQSKTRQTLDGIPKGTPCPLN